MVCYNDHRMKLTFPLMGYTRAQYEALPARERVILAAASFEGHRETSRNSSTLIDWMIGLFGGRRRDPWCAYFVSSMIRLAGSKFPIPKRAGSTYSWITSSDVLSSRTDLPSRGSIFIWCDRTRAQGEWLWLGHMGFVVKVEKGIVHTIEGNTNLSGSREGDGVYRRTRSLKSIMSHDKWAFISIRE